jgi:hypothetical protein
MKYNVLIKKCENGRRAVMIAEEIARLSGSLPDKVLVAIIERPICIKKDADEHEAMKLRDRFMAIGAEIEFTPLTASVISQTDRREDVDNYDEEEGGRILTEVEFMAKLKERRDIFVVEKDPRFRNVNIVCLMMGVGCGMWITKHESIRVATDFYDNIPREVTAKLVRADELPATLQQKKDDGPKKKDDIKTDTKTLKPSPHKGAGGTTGGGGDPRAHVTRKGVLALISGKVSGKTIASADIFGKGGFATEIDGILQGLSGLKQGGGGGVGRKGVAGIGFGVGYESGFGGDGSKVDDLIGSLFNSGASGIGLLQPSHRGDLKIAEANIYKAGSLIGGRSRASIMRVVMQNLTALRYAYNKRLREKPGLRGKITCKFAIDEMGKVIFCEVVESNMADLQLEGEVADMIKRWAFEKIDKVGDITEVVYPFAFSQ